MASVDSGRPDPGDLGTWPSAQQRGCLTVVDAATWLGISRAKLYELLAAGEVRSFTIGRSRRVPVGELADFVRRRLEAEGAAAISPTYPTPDCVVATSGGRCAGEVATAVVPDCGGWRTHGPPALERSRGISGEKAANGFSVGGHGGSDGVAVDGSRHARAVVAENVGDELLGDAGGGQQLGSPKRSPVDWFFRKRCTCSVAASSHSRPVSSPGRSPSTSPVTTTLPGGRGVPHRAGCALRGKSGGLFGQRRL